MEAGKHVYIAVPVLSLPDGDEILDWCSKIVETGKSTGMRYMLGETTYYRPQAMYCRRKAAEGAFGQFVFSEGEYFHDTEHGLREVSRRRLSSKAGREWVEKHGGEVVLVSMVEGHSTTGVIEDILDRYGKGTP